VTLNLISDKWIPVITSEGSRRDISPYELLDEDLVMVDWHRPDFNLSCLEFLVGLIYAACAPEDLEDWEDGLEMTAGQLTRGLDRLEPAFNLTGDGPCFAQDIDPLEESNTMCCDALFFDTAGENTVRQNTDILVHRDRYPSLSLPEAAMALFTMQSYAGSGGAGFRVGLRGGGPMTILVDPSETLWDLIWANVPYGKKAELEDFPWMRPTLSSFIARETPAQRKEREAEGREKEKPAQVILGSTSVPEHEVFFSMPRRIRLVEKNGRIVGFRHEAYGTNYEECLHPLSGYYRQSKNSGLISRKVNFARFGYENWIGSSIPGAKSEAKERAQCLRMAPERYPGTSLGVIVGGWNLNKSTASNFLMTRTIIHQLGDAELVLLRGMIDVAVSTALSIDHTLQAIEKSPYGLNIPEVFYERTARKLDELYARLNEDVDHAEIGLMWFDHIREVALELFDELTTPLLNSLKTAQMRKVFFDRDMLGKRLSGTLKSGAKFRAMLEIDERLAA
jgi:CRISPR system Cascade subunit CasA